MNLPNLPTDNLYKFLALFGLVITVSSTYFYVSETHRLEDFANQLDQTSAHLNIKFDAIDNEQSHLKEKYTLLLDSDATKENRFEITNNIVADIDVVAQRLERARIDSATAKMNENRFSEMLDDVDLVRKMSKPFFVLGIVISFFGFVFWYINVQKQLDKILRKKAIADPDQVE